MSPTSYAVIGVGGVGGLYGARLQRAGHDVHFLLRSDYEHVRQHGLRIDSVDGDFVLPRVRAYADPQAMPSCDVALVALKATANASLRGILPHVVRPDGTILLMQNGIGGEEQMAEFLPETTIIGGLAFLCSYKAGPGHVRHVDYGHVNIAPFAPRPGAGTVAPIVEQVAADLNASGTKTAILDDLVLARWKKLVWNVPYNGLSVVLNATTRDIMRNRETRTLARDLMIEVVQGAAALGRHIDDAFVVEMLSNTERMTPYKPSMQLDYERRRPMEVEAIYGAPLRLSREHGQALPRIAAMCQLLRFLDERNRAG